VRTYLVFAYSAIMFDPQSHSHTLIWAYAITLGSISSTSIKHICTILFELRTIIGSGTSNEDLYGSPIEQSEAMHYS
jgi:hypothetical protein